MNTSERDADSRWQAPQFDGGLMTAADLESLQQAARDEARAEGLQRGLEEGRAQGLAEARDELGERVALLDTLFAHLVAPLESLEEAIEVQLAQMVSVMVGRMFRRQLELDPDSIIGLVREAVTLLPVASSPIDVHLHPDDADRLEAILGREARDGDAPDDAAERWQIVRDPALTRGGCRIASESSSIDARVESRIASMVNALMGDQRA